MTTTDNDKALLILDLDETLIYSSTKELGRPCDFKVFDFHVYKRPYLDKFLMEVFSNYKVAIWSTGSNDYVYLLAKERLERRLKPVYKGYKFRGYKSPSLKIISKNTKTIS